MSGLAVGTMLLVCSVIWGGFLSLLARAVRREGEKERQRNDAS